MIVFQVSAILVLFIVIDVRCENGCEVCLPYDDVKPVCALVNDQEKTYASAKALECNIACGLNAKFLNDGPCKNDNTEILGGFTCETCEIPLKNWYEIPTCVWINGKKETFATPRHAYCNHFCSNGMAILHHGDC